MTGVMTEILFVAVLIIGNGALAMSELAIISARQVRLSQIAAKGNKGAEVALKLAAEPNQFLSAVQIGITLVGILAGAFGGATIAEQLGRRLEQIPVLAPYSEGIGVAVVVLGITYFSLVFGELVPKRLALNRAEQIASAVARPVRLLSVIASPAVRLLSFSTDAVLRVFGGKPSGEPPITEDEIRMLMRQGTAAGVFEAAEENLVRNVFRLVDKRVVGLMTPRHEIAWLDIDDPPEANQNKIARSPHSRFPVCEGSIDKVVGVVRAKDLLVQQSSGQAFNLQAVMRQPILVPESTRAVKVLEVFKQTGRHLAVVVDEHGGTEGLVTHHDMLQAIVGDIPLAGELAESPVVQREDGSWLIDGAILVDELRELLQLKELPWTETGKFQTLGGFMMTRLGRIPSVGEHFELNGVRFEVVDMDGRRVDKVLIAPRLKSSDG
ncbi:MAG: hemolysin family protein [Acidobacteriota bacterium]